MGDVASPDLPPNMTMFPLESDTTLGESLKVGKLDLVSDSDGGLAESNGIDTYEMVFFDESTWTSHESATKVLPLLPRPENSSTDSLVVTAIPAILRTVGDELAV